MQTDFKPMIDFAFQMLDGVVLTAVPIVVGYFASRWFHIQGNSALGQRIIATASNAAAYGLSKAQGAADAGVPPMIVQNQAVAAGVAYFNNAVSTKALDAAKITAPVDQMVEAQLKKLLIAAQSAPPVAAPVPPAA